MCISIPIGRLYNESKFYRNSPARNSPDTCHAKEKIKINTSYNIPLTQ